jgi:4a-hydroxytetrahydrobiopterin dehydratase
MLTDEQLAAALADLPGWQADGPRIRRVYEFGDFAGAMRFVRRIADLAEAQNHHPEILVQYKLVTLTLWSHDKGVVTKRDVRLARAIDGTS